MSHLVLNSWCLEKGHVALNETDFHGILIVRLYHVTISRNGLL